MEACEARRTADGAMHCDRCRITWDYDDPERPECLTGKQIGRRALDDLKAGFLFNKTEVYDDKK